jgi:hypothetical protein
MAITLDGTSGITSPNDTTGNQSYTGTLTGGTGVVNLGSGQFYKDASGNIGVGTASPNSPAGSTQTTLHISNSTVSTSPGIHLTNGDTGTASGDGTLLFVGNAASTGTTSFNVYNQEASPICFFTATAERMRINSNGTVSIGTTGGDVFNPSGIVLLSGTNPYAGVMHASGSASGSSYAIFAYNSGIIGSITQNGTTAVLYNTTSDYRLKTDVTPITNALATVKALNPVNFTWTDGRKDDGFLAHEIQAVIPNCVTGEKDAVNEDGTPKYQQMDNSGVIPFLVKAIQEQQALIESLTTRLTALEAK